ncbi:MAG: carbohydrate ABC transporter permease [Chloroflexi bacterium]|nr:carbohydrate ABC transporter permease [Chloroflexota bacterium]
MSKMAIPTAQPSGFPRTLRRSPRRAVSAAVWYIVMIFASILVVIPFIWMISTSFKDATEVFSYPITWIPKQLRWQNYIDAWHAAPFARYFFNSGVVAFAVTLGQLISCSLAAFAFARMNFIGKNFMFSLFLSTTMISTQVTLIPSYLVIKQLNWQDTYQGLIVPFLANAFGVFMIRQAFMGLPRELEDAARLDGCSRLRFLWQIAIPLTRPVLGAQALFAFMGNWNSYLWPLVVTNRQEMRTLQIGLRYFVSQEGGTQWGIYMAAAVMVTIPVILFYFLVQKSFVEGIATTGIKR